MEPSYSAQRNQKSSAHLTHNEDYTHHACLSLSSLLLQSSPTYNGLLISPNLPSKFQSFPVDPLYKFPIISSSKERNLTAILDRQDFISADLISLKSALTFLHDKSPFRRGNAQDVVNPLETDQSSIGIPRNSINNGSTYSQALLSRASLQSEVELFNLVDELAKDSFTMENSMESSAVLSEIDKQEISINSKAIIMQLQRNFACKQDNDMHLHSITPESSLGSDEDSEENTTFRDSRPIFDTRVSMQAEESLFNQDSIEPSEILFDGNIKPIAIQEAKESFESLDEAYETTPSCVAELLPEEDGENSEFLFRSIEALKKAKIERFSIAESDASPPPGDEGSIRVSAANRLFLNGQTASKAKLATSAKDQSPTEDCYPKAVFQQKGNDFEYQDMNSPILQKIVVCEESVDSGSDTRKNNKELKVISIQFSVAACGFSTVPTLEFSNYEGKSRALIYLEDQNSLLNTLFSAKILREFGHNPVKWISCGFEHCAAVSRDGKVFTWGYGSSGCLGHGDTNSYTTPTLINSLFQENISYLECGGYHNVALSEIGQVWVWGRNDVHQLGISLSRMAKDEIGHVALIPMKIRELKKCKGIACGQAHTLVLDSNGKLNVFGWAEDGQLGISASDLKEGVMTTAIKELKIPNKKPIKVSAGSIYSACLTESGEIYVWGNGEQGQLGLGINVKGVSFPTLINSLGNEMIIDIQCGESHMICLAKSGKVYGWGQGIVGDFGSDLSFPRGSDMTCSVPRVLNSVDIAHRYIVKKDRSRSDDLASQLSAKLMKLKQ
ncbi:unnamed protein product [Blepharisma stoltei]|uniref:Uncharacterized protein n=1 Tax=Blepharisma stoltei TaxID=1481888 RepID=A0AAU9IA12_9CILI|nr:unnamed protein product [Blepharisma stoltei]